MKQRVLYFFCVCLCVVIFPIAASKTSAANETPILLVNLGGEIIEMTTEEYAYRAVLGAYEYCETPETLSALAVSARSCAVYFSLYGCKHTEYNACADESCCIKLGNPNDFEAEILNNAKKAVDDTYGEVLLTSGFSPALALFTYCSGGATRECGEFSYLISVGGAKCQKHITNREITAEELAEIDFWKAGSESCFVYDDNQKCRFGIFGNKAVSGEDIAKALHLPSVEFTIESDENGGICAESRGIGHGYGLSLCGANDISKEGIGYKEIIKIYYPELKINKVY